MVTDLLMFISLLKKKNLPDAALNECCFGGFYMFKWIV